LNSQRVFFLFLLATTSFAQVRWSALAVARSTKPNVVFILADDLGYGDIECFGGERCQIETPGFDQLARQGMRFTDAHANASHCIPTRVAIMTGRYPWRFAPPTKGGPWGFLGTRLPLGQHTLGRLMKSAGYCTAYIGKWHLGTRMQTIDGQTQGPDNVDYHKPLTIGPQQYGFDESFILPGSLDMYPYAFIHDNHWVGDVTAQKGWSAFNRVGPAAVDFKDTKVLDTLATHAEQFINERASKDHDGEPFFLYLALTAPHTPVSPSAKFQGKSRLGIYGDFVMETDDCVRRVLHVLEANGLGQNTLIIATSDHGAAPLAGPLPKATPSQIKELEQLGHFSCGPYRGYKFSVYEGGLRVPFVARWPQVIEGGTICDRLVGLHDLMATLAEIVHVKFTDEQAPDSTSFLPLFQNPTKPSPRTSMVFEGTHGRVIREGHWKLAICPGSGCGGAWGNTPPREDAWRDAVKKHGHRLRSRDELGQAPFVQLFQLRDDPSESNNLAAQHPEKVRRLLALLEQQIGQGRSTPGPKLGNDRANILPFVSIPKFVWGDRISP